MLTNILIFKLRNRASNTFYGVMILSSKLSRNQFPALLVTLLIIQALLVILVPKIRNDFLVLYTNYADWICIKKHSLGFYH